ncbi:MAG: type VI secretion protein ImpB [Henriciella sp.]|jgi:DNA polymerase-4
MRYVERLESLYLDFDGFFASVMQQAIPALRGKPVGIIPFEMTNARSTTVIACSKEAKVQGCQNVMRVPEARQRCPDLILVPQRPDLFRRAHMALLNEIEMEVPIGSVKSIDELYCQLSEQEAADPHDLADRIKDRIARFIGPHITCSIGFAQNPLLAKIACKMDKPNGTTIWWPDTRHAALCSLRNLEEIPGIGSRMERRLVGGGVTCIEQLLATQPKQMRKLWRSVSGERLWYALHGYAIKAEPTARGMYGHGRVLPPDWRGLDKAEHCARMLVIRAARRMRRDGWAAGKVTVWLDLLTKKGTGGWVDGQDLPNVSDDKACLDALKLIWQRIKATLPKAIKAMRVGVTLLDLSPAKERQLDWIYDDDRERRRWESLTTIKDTLNRKYGKRVLEFGMFDQPPGGWAGAKISYTRIPDAEDFY